MGKIRARVSQGGGNDDAAILGIFDITVSLNPGDSSTTVPANISCSLIIGTETTSLPQIGSGPNSSGGINISFSYSRSAIDQSYTLSNFQNVPAGDTVENPTGTVTSNTLTEVKAGAQTAAKAPASKPAGSTLSLWQRIIQFFRNLFR